MTASDLQKQARGFRVSIRLKVLLAVSVALLLAVGSYGYLAVSMFTADKRSYIYDLNSTVVSSLTEQTRTSLGALAQALSLFAHGALKEGANRKMRSASAQDLFGIEQDMLRVSIWRQRGPGFELWESWSNRASLDASTITDEDLLQLAQLRPLPLAAIAAGSSVLYVQNSSLPPEAAILTVALKNPNGTEIVVGDLRHSRLLRAFTGDGLQQVFLVDDRGRVVAHPNAQWVVERRDLSGDLLVKEALRAKVDQGVKEFADEKGNIQLSAFGRVGVGRLWVLAQVPESVAFAASRQLTRKTALFAVAVLLAAFIVSIFFSRIITSPIRRLRAATEVIGKGQFDVQTNVRTRDEIGDLARSFEQMAGTLKEVQSQLIQSEKMAAFGQLGAGITHEVKNPMTGIISFAQLAQRKLEDPVKLDEFLKIIEKEALRCRDILVNFLKFARASSRDLEPLDVNQMVETAATMVRHQLSVHNVRLEVELGADVPPVLGNAPELQQVLLNLAINAQYAMPQGGKVTMRTHYRNGGADIEVQDTGVGIPPDIRAKIFEPFFTTKEPGEGTGLGLSVSFGIIKAHNGILSVESAPGEGATFTIHLPEQIRQADSDGK